MAGTNYAAPLPNDRDGQKLQEFPAPKLAVTRYQTENGVASSAISLQPNTTTIEVAAIGGQGAVIRWVPITETSGVPPARSVVASGIGANFDHFIAAGQHPRRFVVPRETQGQGTGTHQYGSTFGLYQQISRINAGTTASSILIAEF